MLLFPPVKNHGNQPGLMSRAAAVLFLRNAIVSSLTFAVDMALIWLMVSQFGISSYLAVVVGFIIANALHYGLARLWVFQETERGVVIGYLYFLGNALIGLGIIMGGFALLTDLFDMHYLVARVLVSLFAGVLVFILNATLNFHAVHLRDR